MNEPVIHVGILLAPQIRFTLLSTYRLQDEIISVGDYSVECSNGKVRFRDCEYDELVFESDDLREASFELKDVTIGIDFHWERREDQRFQGNVRFIVENNSVRAVNIVLLENYLTSVISSEMSATSSGELLKAHAVISRSWLLAQIRKSKSLGRSNRKYETSFVSPTAIIRWYDREDHDRFDVCADDHCQRYQGVTRASAPLVSKAIDETRGEVLLFDEEICDARFSKCCGGIMETFENTWEPVSHPYLVGKADNLNPSFVLPDLSAEEEAEEWIRTSPEAFCNTSDANVLKQVLNDYDRETADFFRWKVEYSQHELAELIKTKSGTDYGGIIALEPEERGRSGRITRLKIIGTKRVMTIGKELEIRRTLSKSHLYSSAFVVDAGEDNEEGIPRSFVFTGAGWGHGVGLCQIGAAVMADRGYEYRQVLAHYFPGSQIKKHY